MSPISRREKITVQIPHEKVWKELTSTVGVSVDHFYIKFSRSNLHLRLVTSPSSRFCNQSCPSITPVSHNNTLPLITLAITHFVHATFLKTLRLIMLLFSWKILKRHICMYVYKIHIYTFISFNVDFDFSNCFGK